MSLPTDLHAFLQVARGPRDLLNGGPPDAIFPGFFVRVFRNEGYDDLLGQGGQADRQVTLEQALAIADAFDEAAGVGPRTRTALVGIATQLAQDIDRQIATAEAAIERLPKLRERVEQLRTAQAALAEDDRPWFRLSDTQGITIRWVRARDQIEALRTVGSLASVSGPFDAPGDAEISTTAPRDER